MKMETTNPGGSSKDRPALEMILAAERDGLLQPGGTIVEPTSGNTGVGLAIVAAQRGYQCVFVMTDKVAPEKISLLRAYGAEVDRVPGRRRRRRTRRATTRSPSGSPASCDAFRPNQYANPNNPLAHEQDHRARAVAPDRRADHPLRRRRRHVRHRSPAPPATSRRRTRTIRIIAADPEGSVFSGGSGRPYLVEGVGEDFFPAAWEPELYDEIIADQRRGELPHRPPGQPRPRASSSAGPAGMAVAAAIQVAKRGRARRHRRRAQPRLRPRLPVARVRRRLDGQLRLPPASATSASAPCSTRAARRSPTLLYVNPDQHRARGDRRDARQRRQPAAGVQEHAAVRRRRGVGLGRRARADGGDRTATRR